MLPIQGAATPKVALYHSICAAGRKNTTLTPTSEAIIDMIIAAGQPDRRARRDLHFSLKIDKPPCVVFVTVT